MSGGRSSTGWRSTARCRRSHPRQSHCENPMVMPTRPGEPHPLHAHLPISGRVGGSSEVHGSCQTAGAFCIPLEPSQSATGFRCSARFCKRLRKVRNNTPAAMGESSPTFRCRTGFRRRVSGERDCVLQSLPATVLAVSKARRRHRSRTATSRGRGSPRAILPVSIRIPGFESLQTALVGNGLCRYTV